MPNDPTLQFTEALAAALANRELLKATLSKPARKSDGRPRNLYGKLIEIKGNPVLQITHRYLDREEAKNYNLGDGQEYLLSALGSEYLNGDLFTPYGHVSISYSRKGNARLTVKTSHLRPRQNEAAEPPTLTAHNREKHRDIPAARPYLRSLGITNQDGVILPAGRRKFKQINKFIEVIAGLLREHELPTGARNRRYGQRLRLSDLCAL